MWHWPKPQKHGLFFPLFSRVKGRLACTLGIWDVNLVCHWWDLALSGRFMWCGGLLLSPEKAGLELGRWRRCFGSSAPPHQSGVFSKAREDEGGSWVVAFGRGWCNEKYGPTHTNTNAQKAELSLRALTVDRVIQHGVPQGPQAGCTTVIPTQPSHVISQCNLTCQRGQGATA